MSGPTNVPRLSKWPFLLADSVLLALAAWLVLRPGPPLDALHNGLVTACVALAAWLGVTPFRLTYAAEVKAAESRGWIDAIAQIQKVEAVAGQITSATGRWQSVQEAAATTARTADEIAKRITEEARQFTEFMHKANDAQSRHLQLEVEKLRRGEGEWLQALVRMLDHVYALAAAGARSGQPNLVEQLNHFQAACRDAARRVGLVAVAPATGTPFDAKAHQVLDEKPAPDGALIQEVLATGYTFQGQLIRQPLVRWQPADGAPAAEAASPQAELQIGAS